MKFALAALLALPLHATAADWESKDTALLGGALGLLAVDWAQTRKVTREEVKTATLNFRGLHAEFEVSRGRAYHENNPLLGHEPSNAEINRYFLVMMSGTAIASHLLQPRPRRIFLGTVIVVESIVVLNNHRLGLQLSSRF